MTDANPLSEQKMVYSQLATLGLMLIGLDEMAPWFVDEGTLPGWAMEVSTHASIIRRIPWAIVAGIGSLIPFGVVMSKQIPRTVTDRARHKSQLEGAHRSDVLGEAGTAEPERRQPAY